MEHLEKFEEEPSDSQAILDVMNQAVVMAEKSGNEAELAAWIRSKLLPYLEEGEL